MINEKTLNKALEFFHTRKKLAEAGGVTHQAVWFWIHRGCSPTLTVAMRIERASKGHIKATDWVKNNE